MLICLDAGMAYSQRYSDLAAELAAKETDPRRKAELKEISRICAKVPAGPAKDFREAMQAMVMVHVLEYCEVINVSQGFARIDQYLLPYYMKSVYEDKSLTREEATELVELWEVKLNEVVEIYNYDNAQTQMGFTLSLQGILGGQTRDGRDAVNELSYVILDAEEQVGLKEPDFGCRVFSGTDQKFIRRVA
jgi:formate C-acetyltransferase